MRVSDLMQTEVQSVAPDVPVQDAATMLADSHVSALPVVGIGGMVGVISRTDILAAEEETQGESGRQVLFEETLVRDLMTSPALTIAADAEVTEAARQMLYTGVHRLFVTSDTRLVGVISTTDIMRAVAAGQL